MLSKYVLLFFVGLLTATSAFSGVETKSFFGLKHSNSFLPYFHNLKSGMIGYLYETSQYLQFDIYKGDFTIILTNLTQACGQKYSTYDPLHYHVNTSTLVYYCLANNTLLILNETDFTVNSSIPINVTSTFDQVRLYSEGHSIVILGLIGAFTPSSSPTQLLKINLKTSQVTKQFTLEKGLLPGEVVTAYASTKLLSFVLTMTYTDQINSVVTIYSLVNVKKLYKLVRLVAFSMHFSDQPLYTVLSDLNILGQFLVTNDNSNLLFYNLTGGLADTFYNIGFNTYGVYLPTVTMSLGSPELYALFANQKILEITTDGLLIPSYIVSNASSDMHLATGTKITPDMLLAVNPTPYTSFDNLTITNLGTGQLAYTAPAANFDCLYITNTTFTGVSQYYIYVFNLTTNLLVYYREVASRAGSNYYDQVTETLYFIESTGQNYQIGYLNLQTLDNGTSYPFNISINYNAQILHVKNGSDPAMPSFVIQQDSEDYSIFTAASGVTTFSTSVEDQSSVFLVPNYDNMSFYFGSTTLEQGSVVYQYLYNFTNKTYELQNSYRIWESYFDGFNSYYIIDSETAVFIYRSYVMEYKLPNTKLLYQPVTDLTAGCTGVYDNKGDLYLILEGSGSNDNYVPTAFDLNNQVIDSLWKVSNISDNSYAASAGYNSLMITTGTYQGSATLPIQLTKFYNVSAGNSSEDKVSVVSY